MTTKTQRAAFDWVRLGQVVQDERIRAGFKQREEFAARARISPRTLGNIERGRPASATTMVAIEIALDWPAGRARQILVEHEVGPAQAQAQAQPVPSSLEVLERDVYAARLPRDDEVFLLGVVRRMDEIVHATIGKFRER